MLSLLRAKAERRELIICLPQHNDLTRTLAEAGAEVCTFGEERLESPTSRFTIAFFERAGTRVAVGRADHDTHVIEEFDPVSHPAFYMATDLIRLARNLSGTVPAK
jgi:hypothetical protein